MKYYEAKREYPAAPLIGVGALIIEEEKIVLIRRGAAPSYGEWSIPGGLVKLGETLSEAVVREAYEETGLEVEAGTLVELLERIYRNGNGRVQYHYVIADYLCKVVRGRLSAGSDAMETAWVDQNDLSKLNIAPVTLKVIQKAFDMVTVRSSNGLAR